MQKTQQRRLAPTLSSMGNLIRQADIKLNKEQLEQLWTFHNLLRARNSDRDLTRIIGFEPMVIKHYIDCMMPGKFVDLPSPLVDLGSGAGFPGIPLKIRYPHIKMILAEPRPRRISFLNEAIGRLRFNNISVFEHKVVSQSFTIPVAGVITRAVETMDKTILRTSGCLPIGGKLIFLKGPQVEPELEYVNKHFRDSIRLIFDKEYHLPHLNHLRRLIVYEKVGETR